MHEVLVIITAIVQPAYSAALLQRRDTTVHLPNGLSQFLLLYYVASIYILYRRTTAAITCIHKQPLND